MNVRIRIASVLFLAVLAGTTFDATADRILFKDGRVLDAIVLDRTPSVLTVRNGGAQLKLRMESISEITPGTAADHVLIEARAMLGEGHLSEAVSMLAQAAREGADRESLAAVMLSYSEEIAKVIPTLTTAEKQDWADVLRAVESARTPRPGDFTIARLRWALLVGDATAVRLALDELRKTQSRALDERHDEVVQWFGTEVDRALEAGRFSEALDMLLEMRRLDSEKAGGRRIELVLLWARTERDSGNFEKALKIYLDHLLALSPNIARDRIAVTLDEAEKSLRSSRQIVRAIDLYEQFGMPADPERSKQKLADLWHEYGWDILRTGNTAEARRIFRQGEAVLPGSARRDLAYCDYEDAKDRLKADDCIGHYALGEWCLAQGLLTEARGVFEIAGRSEVLRDNVWDQLQRINDEQGKTELARLLDLYERGQYMDVLHGLVEFKSQPAAEGLQAQARQLEDLTRNAIQLSAVERPQQAEVLMQQAERAYWTGDVQQCYNLLKTLMDRYSDTPASARASQFYRLIRPRLDLNTLEQRRKIAESLPPSDGRNEKESESTESASAIGEEIKRLRGSISAREQRTAKTAEPQPASTAQENPDVSLDFESQDPNDAESPNLE